MSRPRRIVWDLDDTLAPSMEAWLVYARASIPNASFPQFSELVENPPHQLLKISLSQYRNSLDLFRISQSALSLPVYPEIFTWFSQRGHLFEHHVLTARPRHTAAVAAQWVFEKLGKWIRHFHFVPAFREDDPLPVSGALKSDVLQSIGGAHYFLDDSEENLLAATPFVNQTLLAPQPWNGAKTSLEQMLLNLS
jgi:hypothetical protein